MEELLRVVKRLVDIHSRQLALAGSDSRVARVALLYPQLEVAVGAGDRLLL